jgi:DNA/RNA endonuclease YhcR with UshA esterase domain
MHGRISIIFASVFIALGAGAQAWAHHSFAAEYDLKHAITVHGTVVQVRLENPHSWFVVDVKDAATGKVDRWSFEAGTPSGMIRNGYRQGMIKPGDEVTIKGFQSKDSDVRGMLRELDTADGHVYGLFGPQANRPDDK